MVQKSISVLEYLLKTLSKIEWFTVIRTGSRRKSGKIKGKWLSIFLRNNFYILLCQHHVLVLLLPTENSRIIDVRSKMIRTGFLTQSRTIRGNINFKPQRIGMILPERIFLFFFLFSLSVNHLSGASRQFDSNSRVYLNQETQPSHLNFVFMWQILRIFIFFFLQNWVRKGMNHICKSHWPTQDVNIWCFTNTNTWQNKDKHLSNTQNWFWSQEL